MTRHDLTLTALVIWSTLLTLAAAQLAAEHRWRRRCARRLETPEPHGPERLDHNLMETP